MGTKNPIEKCREEMGYTEEESDENKEEFINWITEKSFVQRGRNEEDEQLYAFRSYCGDYPIKPCYLGDCEVLLPYKLKEKYYGKHATGMGDIYKYFRDLTEDDLILLDKIVLKLPYSTNYILGRLYTNPKQIDYIYRDFNDGIYIDYLDSCKRIGGNQSVDFDNETYRLTIPLRFGLCTDEQVKSGNYKDLPQFSCKIYTEGYTYGEKYDYYSDEKKSVMSLKIMYD
jgi:hypothetical protein